MIGGDFRRLLDEWIDEQFGIRVKTVIDGSASDMGEYKERCGYLECLKDITQVIGEIEKKLNGD